MVPVRRGPQRCVRSGRTASECTTRGTQAGGQIESWIIYYVAVQNREVNNTDPYWVGITLDSGDGTCVIKKNLGRTEKIQGMTFTRGDYAVAVRWLARDDADSKRLTFLSADHDAPAAQEVFNSTELRCIDLNMTEQKCLAPAGRLTRSGRVAPREKRFVLSGEEESVILNACW